MRMMQVLEANGIRVPHVHGMCPEPLAIIMEWMRGGRDPGLVQEAIESGSVMTDDRWAASLKYMEILAGMHQIPPEQFAEAGEKKPSGASDIGLKSFERFYAMWTDHGIIEPFMRSEESREGEKRVMTG